MMRRSICFADPQYTSAGETATWTFHYQTAHAIHKNGRIKFDLMSQGRGFDWEVPTSDIKASRNVIYGQTEEGEIIAAREVESPESFGPQFEFILTNGLKVGHTFTIVMGTPPKKRGKVDHAKTGTRAQCIVQRRRPFRIHVDAKGKGDFDTPDAFTIDVRGNQLHAIRVLAPSVVTRNKRFDVIIRFEDQYGNLTGQAPEDTLIDVSYENLRETLNWKLFVPETGFVSLPNLYLNEQGIYKICLRNLKTEEKFFSAPIKCFAEGDHSLFWGLLHGESERVDAGENIENCLRFFRDDHNLNFYAASPFEDQEETSNEIWKLISQNVHTFNEEDRFAVMLGFQWRGELPEEGVRHLLWHKDNKPLLRFKDIKFNLLKKIYASYQPKDLLSIPCFTMAKGAGCDFSDFNPDFERVVEIYNAWGSSECSEKEGNLRPIHAAGRKGIIEWVDGSIQKALRNNCRFGFVAGGLDDRGIYAGLYENDQNQYSAGLTGIYANKYSREGLLDALYRRSCYATTGQRIILGFNLAGAPMGSELSTKAKPGLMVNRHIAGFVAGTTDLETVQILRNGELITELDVSGPDLDFSYDDLDGLSGLLLPGGAERPPFVYYYVRVIQKDDHVAWSSPIWIDCVPKDPTPNGEKAPLKKGRKTKV